MSLESKLSLLKDRAMMFYQARLFFSNLGLVEVDTPILSPAAPIDVHIDIMTTKMHDGRIGYFHSSPEYAMKRLISAGMPNIYQISHVYRYGEIGTLHNPEFTMVEWYKEKCSFEQIIEDTLHFVKIFLGELPVKQMHYKEMIKTFTGLDCDSITISDLINYIKIHLDANIAGIETWDKDTLLQYITCFQIEQDLGKNELFVLKYFPATQAALSQIKKIDNIPVAERFEIYYKGIELANGYHELTDPIEQRKRLIEANEKRKSLGKEELPIDNNFLVSLEKGLPDCSGVAVGFDRLMMLRHNHTHLKHAISFSWEEL
jgi:lysyl-tRNA synthetase class 2